MNPEKFKDWLIKINNVNLEKPSQIAYLNALTAQIQQLSVQVHQTLNSRDRKMVALEDEVNKKTSQLMEIQSKAKKNWYNLQKEAQNQQEKACGFIKASGKEMIEFGEMVKRRLRAIHTQFQEKNRTHLEILNAQLQKVKQGRDKAIESRAKKQRNSEKLIKSQIKSSDEIIQSQQKDLQLIEQYQKELMSRCDELQAQYEVRLNQKWQRSQQKQKILLRKLELLISEVEID